MWGEGQCGERGRGRGARGGGGVTDQLPQVRAHLCHFPHQARLTHASMVAAATGDEGKQNPLKSESVRESALDSHCQSGRCHGEVGTMRHYLQCYGALLRAHEVRGHDL